MICNVLLSQLIPTLVTIELYGQVRRSRGCSAEQHIASQPYQPEGGHDASREGTNLGQTIVSVLVDLNSVVDDVNSPRCV